MPTRTPRRKLFIHGLEALLFGFFIIFPQFGFGFLAFSGISHAATINASSCSQSDVQSAVNAASNGDIVQVPSGNCIWNSTFILTKGITLMGAGASSTIITYGSGADPMVEISLPADLPIRISGIKFDLLANPGIYRTAIDVGGKTDGSFGLTRLQIDHCAFNKGATVIRIGGWVYGVIDNNTLTNADRGILLVGDDNYAWERPIAAGKANAMFIEDNNFILNDNVDRDPNEQIYHQEGARSVVRYNTFDSRNMTIYDSCLYDSHGNQNYYTGTSEDFRGQPIVEVYENKLYIHHSYRITYFRGGSILFYNNKFTYESGSAPTAIALSEEESWQIAFFNPLATIWPAQDQINNSFFWGNTLNGFPITNIPLNETQDATFIQKDRDYFMNAPQATGGKETYTGRAGGAMTFSGSGANAYYPYTSYLYPHPLRTGSSAPSPPRNLRIPN